MRPIKLVHISLLVLWLCWTYTFFLVISNRLCCDRPQTAKACTVTFLVLTHSLNRNTRPNRVQDWISKSQCSVNHAGLQNLNEVNIRDQKILKNLSF